MKLLVTFLVAFSLQSYARSYSQGITLQLKNAPLEKVLKLIEQQTKFRFVYSQEAMKEAKPVSIEVNNESLENVLRLSFTDQPLGYSVQEKFIIIKVVEKKKVMLAVTVDIRGKIVNENNEPLVGVTITASKSNKATATNEQGEFYLKDINENDVLIVTSVGYHEQKIPVNGQTYFAVQLKIEVNSLDETIIMAYGKTSRRLNTGNISKVSSNDIKNQPVSNPLAAMEGRVAGLIVTQSSGVPGSAFKVQIRGQSSIGTALGNLPPDDPLFIIDGVPFARGNIVLSQLSSAANNPYQSSQGGLSPFNLFDPSEIESIEILKDADATSIYGSRGANGVILITTKKGMEGKTKFSANIYSGASVVSKTMSMLNTQQYLKMRNEAYRNDGITPTPGDAPDLLTWDTTRFTDFKKTLIGGTAHTTDAQLSLSGGNTNTQFLLSGGYHRETTVFPGDFGDNKASFHINLNHSSTNKRLLTSFSANYISDKNNLAGRDLTGYINLPPDAPPLHDSTGQLNWQENGASISDIGFINPLSSVLQKYSATSNNLLSNINLNYKVLAGLSIKADFGYNISNVTENQIIPQASLDPQYGSLGSSLFGYSSSRIWNIEPQVEYERKLSQGILNILVGSTWQELLNNNNSISASGYTSDLLLQSLEAAGSITAVNSNSLYRYEAIFGRVNYNWKNKYLANITGRRDGSSRFGPGKQFANFGAVGLAWIFSNEPKIKNELSFLSFGKLRTSYGTSGNDQIGDYSFFDLWSSTYTPYQEIPGLAPSRLFNPDYHWEINRKFEAALDLGFFKDHILFSVSYFRNRCGNQLINYILPAQTGFTGINKNFDAIVQNSGLEIQASSKNIARKNFVWNTSLNISVPKNKLVSFSGLATSSYANIFIIGQSLSVINRLRFLGVDPTSGIYQFEDENGDGKLDRKDYVVSGNRDPKFYGGIENSFSSHGWQLDIFFEFKKQVAGNYLYSQLFNVPGFYFNQPALVLNRWQNPGDKASIQRFTQDYGNVYTAFARNLSLSNGVYSDASYIRCKNISLSYSLSSLFAGKIRVESARVYIRTQNLFIITNYIGSDPENNNFYVLPPLKTIIAGIQITF